MNYRKFLSALTLTVAVLCIGSLGSCNKESNSSNYNIPANLAVKSFSLKADSKNPGLDSVYFSIDLEHAVIFNADSLRKGTSIDKIVPLITFENAVSEATIIMSGGTTREGEVDFRQNPTDSIDFTGDVWLRVKADNDEIGMTYRIKVNVHKMDADSLFWDNVSYAGVPTRVQNPKEMKTVKLNGKPVSMVEENDGTFSKVVYESLEDMETSISELTLPFNPEIQSLCASDENSWILDSEGRLWKGDSNLSNWDNTGEMWESLIGTYNESAVGLKKLGDTRVFAQYPLINLNETAIPADFPVRGFSNFVTLENKWTSSPVAFFVGGIQSDGKISDSTWAFDGAEWIRLGYGGIPALEGASVIPYYHFRPSADGKSMIEYEVWMLIGGRESDGSFNRNVYISYNNGVNWTIGTSNMQLPEAIPAMVYCDNIVTEIDKSANFSDAWTKAAQSPRRINYWVQGDVITWECPYIYLFGGYSPEGKVYTNIWRGVLGRLTFMPII